MDKQLAKSIGAAARRARKALQLTQEDAAERIGVSVEFYARIERGNSLPSVPTFVKIATALGISADNLLGRTTAATDEEASWEPAPAPTESPEIRRMMRMLRRATNGTRRIVIMLVKEMEKLQRSEGGGADGSGSAKAGGSGDDGSDDSHDDDIENDIDDTDMGDESDEPGESVTVGPAAGPSDMNNG